FRESTQNGHRSRVHARRPRHGAGASARRPGRREQRRRSRAETRDRPAARGGAGAADGPRRHDRAGPPPIREPPPRDEGVRVRDAANGGTGRRRYAERRPSGRARDGEARRRRRQGQGCEKGPPPPPLAAEPLARSLTASAQNSLTAPLAPNAASSIVNG